MSDWSGELVGRVEDLARAQGVPGVAVGVDHRGEQHFACCGVSHVEHPLPVDERTLFQVASNSKPFVATLLLGLVEEGRVGLDDPVQKHLPEFRMPDPALEDRVTVRHLLTHRVGWDGDELFVRAPSPPTLQNIFEPMTRARQLVPPGGLWTYSNAGFSVAGRLLEVLTGRSFETLLRERILDPLGMEHTCTRADEAVFHRVAMRHFSRPGEDPIVLRGGGWQRGWELAPVDVPAGGVVSCAEDLLRWLRFWLGRPESASGSEPGLRLGDALRAEALAEQLPRYNPSCSQGIGWAIRFDPAARVYNHGGLTAGYCSYTLFVPELDLAMAVLTNGTSGSRVHVELTRWLVGELGGVPWKGPEPLEPQPDLARYEGDYWGSFGITRVRVVSGELEVETERHPNDDGSWQPPPEPAMRARLYERDFAVVTGPEPYREILIDFDPDEKTPAWLRLGGRISVRT